jgi:hypothetical protein
LVRAHPGVVEAFTSERWGTSLQGAAAGYCVKPDARGFRVPVDFLPSGSVVLYNVAQLEFRGPDLRLQNFPRPVIPFLILCGDGTLRPLAPTIVWELREHYPHLDVLDDRCSSEPTLSPAVPPSAAAVALHGGPSAQPAASSCARRFIRGTMVDHLRLVIAPNARCYFAGFRTRFYELHNVQGVHEALAVLRATKIEGNTGAAMSQWSHIWVTGQQLPEYVRVQIFGGPHAAAARRFTSNVWYTSFHVNDRRRAPRALAQPFCIKKYPVFCGMRPAEGVADILRIYNEEQLA